MQGGMGHGMKRLRRAAARWAWLTAGTLVSGCGAYVVTPTSPPTEPTPAGAAKVCIVRAGSDGAVSTFPVKDNGIVVGATVGGSCFCYFAAAGHHELESRSDGFDTLEFDARAGAEQVIVQEAHAAVGIVRARLAELSADEGKAVMKTCQYAVLTQVPDGTYKAKANMVVVAH